MISLEYLSKIKYGDYLELKHSGDLTIGRVVDVHYHKYYPIENKITMRTIVPQIEDAKFSQIVWTFGMLQIYLVRKIESRSELKLLKYLYD
jgi:hypothetical protein